ncbi:MAG: MaoC family dehydratase [Saprospiraceae bacterium]|nr:MaoC family dehydratase [Saprospiraceae bacterium]
MATTPIPEIGKIVEYTRLFTADEVRLFAQISLDNNPIHLDESYAANSIFQQRVVHGMFTGSMFSRIFGSIYPGEGSIYLSQDLRFLKPVFFDQPLTAKVELTAYDPEKRIGTFSTLCIQEDRKPVVKGEARILFPPGNVS